VVDEGSAADIIEASIAIGELDSVIIRDNARKRSDAFKLEAEGSRLGSQLSTSRAESQGRAAIIQGTSDLFNFAADF